MPEEKHHISRTARNASNGHHSFMILFTGLSGSGKSTLASLMEKELAGRNVKTYLLDGDNLRSGINKDLGFSEEDRTENLRRVAEISKLFVDAGMVVLAAFISPLIRHRELIRDIVGSDDYVEIYLSTPLDVCEKRDVKGLYAKARRGEIENFTGISAPYEAPVCPDIEINTAEKNTEDCISEILSVIEKKLIVKK